ncbi:basic salivary proline-rich protein 2-like [Pseudopipra pipra]|uniref:basic salivary proline-rich protein 2-like n=1 Tax=Pseudopipra pipra TaxID=415032 RepID=UPI00313A2E51
MPGDPPGPGASRAREAPVLPRGKLRSARRCRPPPAASRPAGGPGADSPACAAPVAERPRAPGRSGRAPRSAAGPEPAAAAGPVGGILRPGLPGAPRPRPAPPGGPCSAEHPRPRARSHHSSSPRGRGAAPGPQTGRGGGHTRRPSEELPGPPSPGQPVSEALGVLHAPRPAASPQTSVGDPSTPTGPPPERSAPPALPSLPPWTFPPPPQLLGGSKTPPSPTPTGSPCPPARHRHRLLGETRPAAAAPGGAGAGGGPERVPSPALDCPGRGSLGWAGARGPAAPGHRRGLLRTMESGRRYRAPGPPAGTRLPRPRALTFSRCSGSINQLGGAWPGSRLN